MAGREALDGMGGLGGAVRVEGRPVVARGKMLEEGIAVGEEGGLRRLGEWGRVGEERWREGKNVARSLVEERKGESAELELLRCRLRGPRAGVGSQGAKVVYGSLPRVSQV
jgi:hypothetical protein